GAAKRIRKTDSPISKRTMEHPSLFSSTLEIQPRIDVHCPRSRNVISGWIQLWPDPVTFQIKTVYGIFLKSFGQPTPVHPDSASTPNSTQCPETGGAGRGEPIRTFRRILCRCRRNLSCRAIRKNGGVRPAWRGEHRT